MGFSVMNYPAASNGVLEFGNLKPPEKKNQAKEGRVLRENP